MKALLRLCLKCLDRQEKNEGSIPAEENKSSLQEEQPPMVLKKLNTVAAQQPDDNMTDLSLYRLERTCTLPVQRKGTLTDRKGKKKEVKDQIPPVGTFQRSRFSSFRVASQS